MNRSQVPPILRRLAALTGVSFLSLGLLLGLVNIASARSGGAAQERAAQQESHAPAARAPLTPNDCVNAMTSQGPPTSTIGMSIGVGVPTGNFATGVISIFHSFAGPCDAVLFQGNQWLPETNFTATASSIITGLRWFNLPSLADATATITGWAPYVDHYGYSIEYGFRTPPDESQNPSASGQAAAALAAAHGLVYMAVPSQLMSNDNAELLAPSAEMYVTQNFGALKSEDIADLILQVEDIASRVRSVNPTLPIVISLSAEEDFDDPQVMYSLAAGLVGTINGVAIDTSGRQGSLDKLAVLVDLLRGKLLPTHNGIISDHVFLDNNNNGTFDLSLDTPLPGITLTLDNGLGFITTTTSSITGLFQFTGLAPNSFTMTVDTTPFPPGHFTSYVPEPVAVIYNSVLTMPVPLYPTYLAGTVYQDDNQNAVFDQPEEPALPGVVANLERAGAGIVLSTTSDISGSYAFSALTTGDYTITVAPETLPADYFSFLPSRFRMVAENSTIGGLDFPIQPPSGVISGLIYADLDSDSLFEPPGELPVPGVVVSITAASDGRHYTATSTADGSYQFLDLPGDVYTLDLDPATIPTSHYNLVGGDKTLLDGGSIAFNFPLRINNVGGLVFRDNDVNGSFDEGTDTRYQGVELFLIRDDGTLTVTTSSGVSGTFAFRQVVPGTYTVTVNAGTLDAGWFSAISSQVRTVLDNSNFTGVNFAIQIPSAVVIGNAFLDLTVDGIQSGPGEIDLPGAVITLTRTADGQVFTTTSSSNGSYAFTGLFPGKYSVGLQDSSLPPGTFNTAGGNPNLANGQTAVVNFPVKANTFSGFIYRDFDANTSYDPPTDTPYESVVVSLTSQLGAVLTTTTNISGVYTFRALAPGVYTATIDANSLDVGWFSAVAAQVRTMATSSNFLAVNFPVQLPSTVIIGNVFADFAADNAFNAGSDKFLSGVVVSITAASTSQVFTTTSDDNGSYIFEGLSPDTYSMGLIDASLPPGHYNVVGGSSTLANGAVVELDFPVRVNEFAGIVYKDNDVSGSYNPPVDEPYANVILSLAGPGGSITTTSDISGNYSFRGLAPGLYTATIVANSLDAGWFSVLASQVRTVADNSNFLAVDFPIQLPSTVIIGTAYADLDADGVRDLPQERLLAGIVVSLTAVSDGTTYSTTTDDNGSYIFPGLSPGVYSIDLIDSSLPPGHYNVAGGTSNLANGQVIIFDFPVRLNKLAGQAYRDLDNNGSYDPPGDILYDGLVMNLYTSAGTLVLTTTTDISGAYAFRGVAAGTYSATVEASSLDSGWFSAIDGQERTLSDSSSFSGVNFAIQLPSAAIVGKAFGDASGDLLYDSGSEALLPNVVIVLTKSSNGTTYTTTTDIHGTYAFAGLGPARYTVSLDSSSLPPGHYNVASTSKNVLNGTTVIFDFPVQLNSLGGFVFHDTDTNGTYDPPEDSPYETAVISLTSSLGPVITGTTDMSGTYLFRALAAGTYTVTVDESSLDTGWFSPSGPQVRVMADNSNFTAVDFALQLPSGAVAGQVFADLDANGVYEEEVEAIMPGVVISITADSTGSTLFASSDENGDYLFVGLSPDTYRIEVDTTSLPPGHYSTILGTFGLTNNASKVFNFGVRVNSLAGLVYKDLDLSSSYSTAVDLVYPGVVVELAGPGGAVLSATTDLSGTYSFRALSAGSYTATVDPASLDPLWFNATGSLVRPVLDNSNFLAVDFAIQLPQATVSGTVFADFDSNSVFEVPTDTLLSAVALTLTNSGTGATFSAASDVGGGYQVTGLYPGVYTLELDAGTLPPGHYNLLPTINFNLANGGLKVQDYPIRVNSLSGLTYRDYNNNSIYNPLTEPTYSGLDILMTGSDGIFQMRATTGNDGVYTFRAIPPDTYTITVDADTIDEGWFSFIELRKRTVANNSNITNIQFPIRFPAGIITGTIFADMNGDALFEPLAEQVLPGVAVSLTAAVEGVVGSATAAGDGVFRYETLPADTYTIDLIDSTLPPGYYYTNPPLSFNLGHAATRTVDFPVKANTFSGLIFQDLDFNSVYNSAVDLLYPGVVVGLNSESGLAVTTTTDISGVYSFRVLPPGLYTATVDAGSLVLPQFSVFSSITRTVANNSNFVGVHFPIQVPAAQVTGQLWGDLDADGTFEPPGEIPLAGVQMTLTVAGGPTLTATTDLSGTYAFNELMPGSYALGLVESSLPPGHYVTLAGSSFTIANGVTKIVNFPVRLNNLSGTVFHDLDLNNTYSDAVDSLYEGVVIDLRGPGGTVVTATTDVSGAYAFRGLAPAVYTATVNAGSLAGNEFSAVASIVRTMATSSNFVAVNFPVQLPAATLSGFVFGDLNGNNLFDAATEFPLAGVVVSMTGTSDLYPAPVVVTATTGSDGVYTRTEMFPALYSLDIVDSSLPPGHYNQVLGSKNLANGASATFDFAVDINAVTGLVFKDNDRDGLYDPLNDSPYAAAVVSLTLSAGNVVTTSSNVQGLYQYRLVADGTYTLTVDESSLASGWVLGVPSRAFTVSNHLDATVPDYPVVPLSGLVSGSVFGDYDLDGAYDPGEPFLAGVVISLTRQSDNNTLTQTTDLNGDYAFLNLEAGVYAIDIIDSSLPPGHLNNVAGTINLTTGESESFEFAVRVNAFGGLVYHDLDFNASYNVGVDLPYDSAVVDLATPGGAVLTATANISGVYAFHGLAAGTYTATVDLASLSGSEFSVVALLTRSVITTSNFTSVNFPIQVPAGVISGFVFADLNSNTLYEPPEDVPLAGVVVSATASSSGAVFTATSGLDGYYAITTLMPGTYLVDAADNSLPPGHYNVASGNRVLSNGEVEIFDFPVRLNSLSGLIYRDNDNSGTYNPPVDTGYDGAGVILTGSDGVTNITATTNISGNYVFRGMPADVYTVTVDAASLDQYWFSVVAFKERTVADNSIIVNVDFATQLASAQINGLVFNDLDGDGNYEPPTDSVLPGVVVSITHTTNGTVLTAAADASGNYTFTHLVPGVYALDVADNSLPPGHYNTTTASKNMANGTTFAFNFGIKLNSLSGFVFHDYDGNGSYDPPGDTAYGGAVVALTEVISPAQVISATTAGNGNWSLRAVPAGIYSATVQESSLDAGWISLNSYTVTVAADSVLAVPDFPLQPLPASISGTLFADLDNDGLFEPPEESVMAGIVVSITRVSDSTLFTLTSGLDGTYLLDGLEPGLYAIDLADNSLPPGTYNVLSTNRNLAYGDQAVADFGVRLNSLSGLVFRDNDNSNTYNPPIDSGYDGAVVALTGSDGVTTITATTNISGNYVFRALPPDTYSITVEAASIDPGWFSVTPVKVRTMADDSVTANVNFAIQFASAQISGNVFSDLDGDGNFEPPDDLMLPGVVVSITRSADSAVLTVATDASGNYTFTNLLPGLYTIDLADSSLPPGHYNTASVLKNLANAESFVFNFNVRLNSITGFVFRDNDSNGTYDPPGDTAYNNVTVDLTGDGVLLGTISATTNNAGLYKFRGIAAGTYTITVDVASLDTGWTPFVESHVITITDASIATVPDFPIEPPVLGTDLIVDLIQIKPIRQGTQAGSRIYVIDEFDNIIEGATVFVTWTLPDLSTVTAQAATNALGRAQFLGPLAGSGTYTITVTDVTMPGMTWTGGNVTSRSTTLP